MDDVTVVEARTKRERKAFVRFPMDLYHECPYYVPPLMRDELATFSKDNPMLDNAEARIFLARQGDRTVGRIAAILSHAANHKFNERNLRFGWFDCVNDLGVAQGLFGAVETWGRDLGMETLTGPQGFNQFDKTGMLIEGYDQMPTMATYYNFPYYNDLVGRLGFEKHIDAVEYKLTGALEAEFPPRVAAIAQRVRERRHFRVLELTSRRQMLERADELLDVLDETYEDLCDSVPLNARQRQYYTKKFFPYLSKDLVKVVVNGDDEMVGFIIAMPSLSRALQRTRGRLFPFGIVRLWRATRRGNEVLDLCLGGIKREYRGKGVDLIMGEALHRTVSQMGFRYAESNPELETNVRVRSQWRLFDHTLHKRRRVYRKPIAPAASPAP